MSKKCAIIITKTPKNIDVRDYDLLIGVEKGSLFVYKYEGKIDTSYISDFDSLTEKERELILSLEKTILLNHETKLWADGEEAIHHANKLGYDGSNIDIFVDTSGREDHFVNMIMVNRKFGTTMISERSMFKMLLPNIEYIIEKRDYDYVSFTFFKQTKVKTDGLKWEIDKGFDVTTGTNCISNEFLTDECRIMVDQKTLLMLVEEK